MNISANLILVAFLFFSFCYGQNEYKKADDRDRIVLTTFIPDNVLESTPSARKLFVTKLSQIATRHGIGGGEVYPNNRFIISGDLNILTKDVLPTAPPKFSVTIETNIAIGDGIDGKSFASEYLEFKGVGTSEDKAFISAIRKINPKHKSILKLIENGKQRIIEYYNSQCDFIQKEASAFADSRQFDEGVYVLSQVPQVTNECYQSSMDLAAEIVKRKYEFECQSKISEARALISNGDFSAASELLYFYTKDMECYNDLADLLNEIKKGLCSDFLGQAKGYWANRDSNSAAMSLAKINSSSPCYEESLVLANEIARYLDEKEKREWNLDYEKYKDRLVLKNREMDNESSRIAVIREIGVAYGKNQPRNITYSPILR